jgi:hypothetical protein
MLMLLNIYQKKIVFAEVIQNISCSINLLGKFLQLIDSIWSEAELPEQWKEA